MSKNKNLVCDLINQYWNEKKWCNSLDAYLCPHLIHDLIVGKRIGRETLKMMSSDWCKSFPDLKVTITQAEEIGKNVIVNMKVSGTFLRPLVYRHTNSDEIINETNLCKRLVASKPTKQKIFYEIGDIYFFEGNQIVQYVSRTDAYHLFNQIHLFYDEEEYQGQKKLKKNHSLLISHLNSLHKSHLSKREIECLSLSILGFSSKQIASFFGLSYRTIETHLGQALHKLKAYSCLDCIEKMLANQTLLIWYDLGKIVLKQFQPPFQKIGNTKCIGNNC